MKTLEKMTRDERSLLLFFEACAVDHGGRVNTRHMNDEDRQIAEEWNEEGFCQFGRVGSKFLTLKTAKLGTHWCKLSDEAWKLAHVERKARGIRMWDKRTWLTTEEKE